MRSVPPELLPRQKLTLALCARRAVESLFRSLNNLLERFHQSFFLYLMTSVDSFVAVGNYLAAPILLGAGLTVEGLLTWTAAAAGTTTVKGAKEMPHGGRPLVKAAVVVVGAAAAGAAQLRLVEAVDPTAQIHVRPALSLSLSWGSQNWY